MRYTGRFAPSPTGPLHFGSLLAALASYADARAHQGHWLVRIEDLDPPREQPGATGLILSTLEAFGFEWDGPVLYQSERHALYREALESLLTHHLAYRCGCSRREIQARTGSSRYDGHCRRQPPGRHTACAIRACTEGSDILLADPIQGPRQYNLSADSGDFVIHRRDGLFAYQLAVVVDDADQGITRVVRGSDLLDETPRQLLLQRHLAVASPQYAHIPVATACNGQKLSKQTHAPALDPAQPIPALLDALAFLGQRPDRALTDAAPSELLQWAVEHWKMERIPRTRAHVWPGD